MRKRWLVYLALLLSGASVVLAQAPAAPAAADKAVPAPSLTATETVAVMSLTEKFAATNQTLKNLQQTTRMVEAEIAKEHPGYHLDEPTGTLVKDAPPAKDKPAAVAPPKDTPKK